MGDLSYWDDEGHRFRPRGVDQPSTPVRRNRAARPPRAVVRQLLALLDV